MGDPVVAGGLAGFGAGLVGALITEIAKTALNERLKSAVDALEAELTRLNGLHDDLLALLDSPPTGERGAGARKVFGVRRRVGINLKELIHDELAFAEIGRELSRIDRLIKAAEDGEMLDDAREEELDGVVLRLRRLVRRRSNQRRAYRALRSA